MMTLEQEIEATAKVLGDWRMRIEIENGRGGVTVERPDGTEVDMDCPELDLVEQVAAVRGLIRDEIESDKLSNIKNSSSGR